MKHTYHINGMTCDGCRKHVEKTLSKVEGVSSVSVDLEMEEAEIEMELHIPIEIFQESLKNDDGNYDIHQSKDNNQTKDEQLSEEETGYFLM